MPSSSKISHGRGKRPHLEKWLKRREQFFGMVDEVRQRQQDAAPEAIEQDIQDVICAIRAGDRQSM
jgi:hypothetical protein